jgi:SAM-dependent methyltransferase
MNKPLSGLFLFWWYMDWELLWNDAIKKSPFNVHNNGNNNWSEYWDTCSEHYFQDSMNEEPLRRDVIRYLYANGAFLKDCEVLDIGCGPGTYSLIFAEMAKKVDGLDISRGMLRQMQNEASIRGLNNINSIQSSWGDFQADDRYDLVFSSFSPAVFDAHTLIKMEQYSRGTCCYVTNGGSYTKKIRDQLWEMLTGEVNDIDPYDVTYPFNYLYSRGRKPDVKFFMIQSSFSSPSETMIKTYLQIFNKILKMDDEQNNIIKKHISSCSRNGIYEQIIKEMIAVIYWKVERE